jgi:hypothetical protein
MTRDLTKPDPLTVREAAAEAGVTVSAIHTAIHRGLLTLILPSQGQRLQIARAEFELWQATRRTRKPGMGTEPPRTA